MSSSQGKVEKNWYKTAFGDLYPIMYAHRTIEAAKPESIFAMEQLNMSQTDHVLDLCCGNGRHMANLRNASNHVAGLDYSQELLELAKANLGNDYRLVRADMRNIPFAPIFDVVTSFFTSFGYFFSDNENMQVVSEVARVIKPLGRVFVDYVNGDYVRKNLVPKSDREYDDYLIHEQRWLSDNDCRVNKSAIVTRNGKQIGESTESVRLYSQKEMVDMLNRAGLTTDKIFGDYSGDDPSDTLPRMIIIAHKE